MTRLKATCVLGLLLAAASSVSAFVPTSVVPVRVRVSVGPNTVRAGSALSVGAILEDKPHMMIGGKGYHNLLVDVNEFTVARAAAIRQRRVQALKLVAGYMVVVCGSFLLRQMAGFLAYLPQYYKTYPLTSAMATCGLKSMIADAISQCKTLSSGFDWKRSLSGLFYGAAVLGAGSKTAYTLLLPRICPSGIPGIATSCAVDNFVLAPLFWLPLAYVVKAIFFRFPVTEAIRNYRNDIQNQGLLRNYWKVWVPAQFLNFAIMPKHYQVPFVAGVGFVWYFVLSSMAYKEG